MLFRQQNAKVKRIQTLRAIALLLCIAVILIISSCSAQKDSIVILENTNRTAFTMIFSNFSAKSKCELSLNKRDVVQFDVEREGGEIAFTVNGKNGSEPYSGNDLQSGIFTVTVSETDVYVFRITGKAATGKITVKNLGPGVE